MARFSTRAFSFSNGEVSPFVQQRADMDFYYTALGRCLNVLPDQFGNLHRRPGTRFVQSSTTCPCFYRFDAATDCPLIIAAEPERFNFILDGQAVVEGVDTPYAAADFCDLSYVEDCGAIFIAHPNYPPQKLVKTETGFDLSPLESSPLGEVNRDQSCTLCLGEASALGADTTGIIRPLVCAAGDVITLTQDAGLTTQDFTVLAYNGGGVCRISVPAGTDPGGYDVWDGAAVTGSVTLSLQRAVLRAEGCAPFSGDMVGQQITLLDVQGVDGREPNTWLTLEVTSFTSTTEVVVIYDGSELECTDLFQLPAFAGGNNPSSVWIHQDRLYFGNENCIAGSEASNFFGWAAFDADGTVNPDNAIYEKIGSGGCSDIQWMHTVGRQLVVGTTTSVASFFGSGVGGSFQADATGQQQIDAIGMSGIRPVAAGGGGLLMVDAARKRIYATGAGAQYDQIVLSNQNIFSDHIGERCFVKIAYQEHPFPIVWAITDDGCLWSMTFWPEQQVRGWARHELGGSWGSGGCDTKPFVCDVEVQKTQDRTGDVVLFAVRRTINGEDVYFTERLGEFFTHNSKEEQAHYVDAAVPVGQTVALPSAIVSAARPVVLIPNEGAAGRVAICDRDRWYYGTADGEAILMDTPNTFAPTPGRTLIEDGEGWRQLARRKYGEPLDFVDAQECLYDPPCRVESAAYEVSAVTGLDHLEGEEVLVYLDACDLGCMEVSGGEVGVAGCVGWVGLPYISEFEPLAYRQQLGSTDGANDASKPITASLNVYRTPEVWLGAPGQSEYMGQGENFRLMDLPEEFETHHRKFHSGWVTGIPFAPLGNNDTLGLIVRISGPWPAIVRGMEATIYASGGR